MTSLAYFLDALCLEPETLYINAQQRLSRTLYDNLVLFMYILRNSASTGFRKEGGCDDFFDCADATLRQTLFSLLHARKKIERRGSESPFGKVNESLRVPCS